MEFINQLVADHFSIFNVNQAKQPVTAQGYEMSNWINMNNAQLVKEHNYKINRWGLRMGKHENGKFVLSLDFDTCGDEVNGVRVGCPETKHKLQEYLSGTDNYNGLYDSSTDGNINVLVDYTNSPIIKDLVNQVGKAKFQHFGLEILLRGNQVIPPTATTCKHTKQLGKPRAFRAAPFYTIEESGFVFDFITNLFKEKLRESPKTITEHPVEHPVEHPAEHSTTDKYLDLLYNFIINTKINGNWTVPYEEWLIIATALKSNYKIADWLVFNSSNKDAAIKLWNGIKSGCHIRALQTIAKKNNPVGYKQWLEKWDIYDIPIKDITDAFKVAEIITATLQDTLKYCRKEWYMVNNNLWQQEDEPTNYIIGEVRKHIDASQLKVAYRITITDGEEKEKMIALQKEYNKSYTNINNTGFLSVLTRCLKTNLIDNDFIDKLDSNLYKIVYRNGILDLKTLLFKNGITPDDYITQTIPFDYVKPSLEKMDYIKEKLKKTCNYNDSHLQYYLSMLGYALTGECVSEQAFFYLLGQSAENGKSLIFEVLELLIPNYVKKANSDTIDKKADLRKEIATWSGVRILWLNEVTPSLKDAEFIKAVSDGTSIKYNGLYSKKSLLMKIGFKLFCISNHSLNVTGDAGIARRLKLAQFESQFKDEYTEDNYERKEFKKDALFRDELLGEYKHALLYLIYTAANAYWNEKKMKPFPIEWANETSESIADNDKFKIWFFERFELGEYSISKFEMDSIMKCSSFAHNKLKDEFKRLRLPITYDSQNYIGTKKGVFVGFRLIEEIIIPEVLG